MSGQRVLVCVIALCVCWASSACKQKTHAPAAQPKRVQALQVKQPAPPESPDEKSCRAFVQKFYDWRASLLVPTFCPNPLRGSAATQESLSAADEDCRVVSAYRNAEKLAFDQVLSPKLRHDLKQEEATQAKEKDAGLDFDPFLNTQDPSPQFLVDSVHVSGNRCDAVVHGYDQGQQREEVMPELSRSSGRWRIENFHYKFDSNDGKPPQDSDLISMIREYIDATKYPAQ